MFFTKIVIVIFAFSLQAFSASKSCQQAFMPYEEARQFVIDKKFHTIKAFNAF